MFKKDWITLLHLIEINDLKHAEIFVKEMHKTYQQHALPHARIHFAWSRIARLKKDYLRALGQWVAGAVFAVPVSIFQKYSRSIRL
jgi:hypothetical protein